ncbi:MAG: hypothetical protein EOP06_16750 [Proteobacteria bacterium]|nr:MAG: hypothetical protein EOP06_16750 [Pseudomonadota bacterium]
MIELNDLTQIGLSLEGQARLEQFKHNGYFSDMRDAYKFAIGLALSKGILPPEITTKRQTMFSIPTVDPDGTLAVVIRALLPCDEIPPYRWAERLADAGVALLVDIEVSRGIDVGALLEEANNELPEARNN